MTVKNYLKIYTGTIRGKDDKKRSPFLIVGDFSSRDEFLQAMKEEFAPDWYDYRTLRFVDDIGMPLNKASVVSLEALQYESVQGN